MELVVLGSGTCVPEAERGPSGYAVRAPGGIVLLDGGSGTVGRIVAAGLDIREVGAWLFTHRHPDHTADLVPFLFSRKHGWGRGPRSVRFGPDPGMPRPLEIRGGERFPVFFDSLMAIFGTWCLEETGPVLCREVPPETAPFDLLGLTVRAFPVAHSDPAVAYRLQDPDGRVLCYSGDTDLCAGIVEAARGADLLLIECSMPDDRKVAGHLRPSEVAAIAHASGARRVLLTHIYPVAPRDRIREACENALGRPVELAYDGMRLEV